MWESEAVRRTWWEKAYAESAIDRFMLFLFSWWLKKKQKAIQSCGHHDSDLVTEKFCSFCGYPLVSKEAEVSEEPGDCLSLELKTRGIELNWDPETARGNILDAANMHFKRLITRKIEKCVDGGRYTYEVLLELLGEVDKYR